MNFLLNIFRIFWRIWFYVVFLMAIVVIFPILLVVTSSESLYPVFFKIARLWAKTILFLMGFRAKKRIIYIIPIVLDFYSNYEKEVLI